MPAVRRFGKNRAPGAHGQRGPSASASSLPVHTPSLPPPPPPPPVVEAKKRPTRRLALNVCGLRFCDLRFAILLRLRFVTCDCTCDCTCDFTCECTGNFTCDFNAIAGACPGVARYIPYRIKIHKSEFAIGLGTCDWTCDWRCDFRCACRFAIVIACDSKGFAIIQLRLHCDFRGVLANSCDCCDWTCDYNHAFKVL